MEIVGQGIVYCGEKETDHASCAFAGIAAYPTALGADKVLAALCWVDHSDPALPFFNEETEGLLDTRIFLSLSKDGGETWSAPRLIDTSPYKVPTPLTG